MSRWLLRSQTAAGGGPRPPWGPVQPSHAATKPADQTAAASAAQPPPGRQTLSTGRPSHAARTGDLRASRQPLLL